MVHVMEAHAPSPVLAILQAIEAVDRGDRGAVDFELIRADLEDASVGADRDRQALLFALRWSLRHLEAGRIGIAKKIAWRALARAASRPLASVDSDGIEPGGRVAVEDPSTRRHPTQARKVGA